MTSERSASFQLRLEADYADIRKAFAGLRGELERSKSDFADWARSASASINQVSTAMRGLSGLNPQLGGGGGVGGGGGGGGGGGFTYGGGGGGGGAPSTGLGVGRMGTNLGSLASQGSWPLRIAAFFTDAASRVMGAIFGIGMQALDTGLGALGQYERASLNAAGMPGGRGRESRSGITGFGLRYGMNAGESLRFVHGIRQPLAQSINPLTGLLQGTSHTAENLAAHLGFGTGMDPQAVANVLAGSQIGGRVTSRDPRAGMFGGNYTGAGGQKVAPPAYMAAYAQYLTTSDAVDGISRFGLTVQETVPALQSLNAILNQHMRSAVRANPRAMEFAAMGLGQLTAMDISMPVAQNIMGGLLRGMQQPGGGEVGQYLMMRGAGYGPGMDPFQARLALESGDPDILSNVFSELNAQYGDMGEYRVMASISSIFGLSAQQSQAAYHMMQELQRSSGEERAEIAANLNQILQGEVAGPIAAGEQAGADSIHYLEMIANYSNLLMGVASQNLDLVAKIFAIQTEAIGLAREFLPAVATGLQWLMNLINGTAGAGIMGGIQDIIFGQFLGLTTNPHNALVEVQEEMAALLQAGTPMEQHQALLQLAGEGQSQTDVVQEAVSGLIGQVAFGGGPMLSHEQITAAYESILTGTGNQVSDMFGATAGPLMGMGVGGAASLEGLRGGPFEYLINALGVQAAGGTSEEILAAIREGSAASTALLEETRNSNSTGQQADTSGN